MQSCRPESETETNACNDAINVTPPGATDKNSRLIRLYLLSKEPVPATSNSKSRTNYRSVHVKDNQNDKFDAFIQTYDITAFIQTYGYHRKIILISLFPVDKIFKTPPSPPPPSLMSSLSFESTDNMRRSKFNTTYSLSML